MLETLTHQNTLVARTQFRNTIVPADRVPELGEIVQLISPIGYGLARYRADQRDIIPAGYEDDYRNIKALPPVIVLFAPRVEFIKNVDCLGNPITTSIIGRILHAPVPSSGDPRWKKLSFSRLTLGFYHIPGQYIDRADLMMFTQKDPSRDWNGGTNVHAIEDIRAL